NSANYRPPGPEHLADAPLLVRFYLGRPFAAFASLSLLISAGLLVGSTLVLRRVGRGEAGWLRRFRRLLGLAVAEGGERRRKPREVWQNPIAWREAHTRGRVLSGLLARWGFAALALLAGVALVALYHFNRLPAVPGPTGQPLPAHQVFHAALLVLLLLEVAVVVLVAIYMSAGSVSREREDGTLDLILATPMTPRYYIWGKLRGLVSFLTLLMAVPVFTVALASLYALVGYGLGWEKATFLHSAWGAGQARITHRPLLMLPEAAVLVAVVLTPFVALCVAAGMTWSLRARSILGAVVPTVISMGLLTLVMSFCGLNAVQGVRIIGPIISAFSPVTSMVMIVDPWAYVDGFAEDPALGRLSLVVGALIAAGGYSFIVYAMIQSMVRGFDHTVRRLSGA
ncbi:MAG TPA: hypothetical protein VF184_03105, partial [Phycisphaeraceae bacterium]